MNALIINDEKITTEMLRDKIGWQSIGVDQVFLAFDAEEAKQVFTQHSIDVCLCDIEMPGEDGIQLIRWVKEKEIDTDCILLTCHADFEYAQEALRLGCQDYLLLPARYPEITKSIAKTLAARQERKSAEEMRQYGKNWLEAQTEKAREKGVKSTRENVVKNCIAYIQSHLSSPELSVHTLAEALFLNRVYLNRIFREETGIALSQYIIDQRMKLAVHLLEDPELSLDTIAENVGYGSYSHFANTFTKHFGRSPSQYRKRGDGAKSK